MMTFLIVESTQIRAGFHAWQGSQEDFWSLGDFLATMLFNSNEGGYPYPQITDDNPQEEYTVLRLRREYVP
jgi:hypothetical protein